MRTGALIYPLLANFAGLTAIVAANKIFALRAQQPTNAPYITYRMISSQPTLDREWGAADAPYAADIELDSCIYDSSVDDFDEDFGANGIYIKHLDFTCRVNRIDISN